MKTFASAFCVIALFALADALSADDKKAGGVTVDATKKTVIIDAKVAPRKLEHLKGDVYPIELIACWPHPKGKKAHETVLTIEANPSDVHKALVQLGLKPGTPAKGAAPKEGDPDPKAAGAGGERVHRSAGRHRRHETPHAREGAHGPKDEEGTAEDDVLLHRFGDDLAEPEPAQVQEVRGPTLPAR